MNDPNATIFQSELSRGETLLWVGRPKQGLIFRSADLVIVPFTLLWGTWVFSLFISLWNNRNEFSFSVTLLPLFFSLFALYMIVGRFVFDVWRRSRTYYAVTSERILILSGSLERSLRSVNIKTLADIDLTLKRDGRGTITLGLTNWLQGVRGSRRLANLGRLVIPMLELIPDAKQVYDVIREAQRSSD